MSEVTVITEAVRNEGRKWMGLSDSVDGVRASCEDLNLGITAFFIGDANAGVHAVAYDGFYSFMVNVLKGAVTEFDQFGNALMTIADRYDQADAVVSLDLNEIYRP
jgi:hypothetical protein